MHLVEQPLDVPDPLCDWSLRPRKACQDRMDGPNSALLLDGLRGVERKTPGGRTFGDTMRQTEYGGKPTGGDREGGQGKCGQRRAEGLRCLLLVYLKEKNEQGFDRAPMTQQ